MIGSGLAAPACRLGFLGAGWIGRHRLEAVCRSGAAVAAAIAEPDPACLAAALALAPGARPGSGLAELLELGLQGHLDGVVIATPSALHAGQCLQALEAGLPVFCQKPLGRNAREARRVVAAARRAGLLLGVDLSYRFTAGARRIRELVADGGLGSVYAARLVFHNAYGPDKGWFFDRALAGGGCAIDLGTHLIDLFLWTLGEQGVPAVTGRCFAGGRALQGATGPVEDFAVARLDTAAGATAEIACSWNLPAGQDAVISAAFYGTAGGAELRNVEGSFYDFVAERFRGTARETLAAPPDDWGGRALKDWARRLAAGRGFDPEVEAVVRVAQVVDALYGNGSGARVDGEAPAARPRRARARRSAVTRPIDHGEELGEEVGR